MCNQRQYTDERVIKAVRTLVGTVTKLQPFMYQIGGELTAV
jgi:hypothetical protein